MNKSIRRSSSLSSRKTPSARKAVKSGRRSSLKSLKAKVSASPRSKVRKASRKARIGLAVAAPRARRLVSRVKRTVSNAIASR